MAQPGHEDKHSIKAGEAREAIFRILRVVFPLRKVLRGDLPLSALIGLSDMVYSMVVMFVSMGNSLWSMSLTASVSEAIYLRNVPRFGTLIVLQLVAMFGENFLYSLREWFRERIARKWRERLSHHLHDCYFAHSAFYRQQLRPSAVSDADERICQDVVRAVQSLSWTLDSTASAVLTAVWNSAQLAWRAHPYYVVGCVLYCRASTHVRHVLSPALAQGQLAGKVAEVTGRYFGAHQKLVQHSEAIATAGGGKRENLQIDACFKEFVNKWRAMCLLNLRSSCAMRVEWSILQTTFMNVLTHAPFLRTQQHRLRARSGATEREQLEANAAILSNMVFQQRLIMRCLYSLSQVFRVSHSLLMLSGSTTRIAELMVQLDGVGVDNEEENIIVNGSCGDSSTLMQLEDVDIDSPTGERLLSGLCLKFSTGSNILIQGDSGRGKTALFRTLHCLWPVARGRIMYCRDRVGKGFQLPSGCLYLAQTPYIVAAASLQDQITFPLQLPPGSVPKEQLGVLMAQVGLDEMAAKVEQQQMKQTKQTHAHLPIDWEELLTYSDRQRMAIARIFYHKPNLVVIDEATVGLGMRFDRECLLEPCRAAGITVVMVSQQRQRSLLQYFDKLLTLNGEHGDGNGGWEMTEMDATDQSPLMRTLTAEIDRIESLAAEERDDLIAARTERLRLEQRRSSNYQTLAQQYHQQKQNDHYQKHEGRSASGQRPARQPAVPTAYTSCKRDQVNTFQRLAMLTRVLFPRVSLYDYAIQRVLLTFVFMAVSIHTSNRVMSELPGQLQALAIQNDLMGYVRLTISGTAIRSLSMVMDLYLTWLNNTLSLHWQEVLTSHVMERYCERNAFSKIIGRGLSDADTRITSEIVDACERLAGLLKGGTGNWGSSGMSMGSGQNWGKGILRPICDAAYMTFLLMRIKLPTTALLTIWAYGTVGILLIKAFAPDFSKFQSETERTQGDFRSAHARLKGDADLIALSGAGDFEKAALNEKLEETVAVGRREANQRLLWMPFEWLFTYSVPSSITQTLRLVWSLGEGTDSDIMANADGTGLSSMGQYIESLTERAFRTFGSILELHTEFGRLFGVVQRVTDLVLALQQLEEEESEAAEDGRVPTVIGFSEDAPDAAVLMSCQDMDVVAPDGRCLAGELTFKVYEKQHMLIKAVSSSSGKSSLFRHLAQIWPIRSGQLQLPTPAGQHGVAICFISQCPLVPTVAASLAEMVAYGCESYPLSKHDIFSREADSRESAQIAKVIELCHLGNILSREGLDNNRRWNEVLSTGEQQCLAIARVVYQRPKLVVIDEGFSAVSSEMRLSLLQTLEDFEITVICISSQLTNGDEGFDFNSTLELGCLNERGWRLVEATRTQDNADGGSDHRRDEPTLS